jgi:hypothetical protein
MQELLVASPQADLEKNIVINDEVFAEIQQEIETDKRDKEVLLLESSTLRTLRSQSSCDEMPGFR